MFTLNSILELGVLFLVAFLAPNINFFLPIRPTIVTILLAQHLPWAAVGLVAVLGGIAGVLPLYGLAYQATDIQQVQRWLRYSPIRWILTKLKGKLFLATVLLVVTPLPDQLIGLTAGAERYSFRRFLAANALGRAIVYFPLAYFAASHATLIGNLWGQLTQLLTF